MMQKYTKGQNELSYVWPGLHGYERDSGYIGHRILIMELPIKRKGEEQSF